MDVASQLVMVAIRKIKPYEHNVRFNHATVEKLIEIIPKVGFNVPLVLDRDNVIVKGHSRWKAAQQLGFKQLPCIYTDADPETIRLDRLADNRIHEFSTWDEGALASEIGALNLDFAFDLGALDFRIDLPAFEVAPARPAAGNGQPPASAEEPFITARDIAETVPQTAAPDYLEVVCHECGNRIFVKR